MVMDSVCRPGHGNPGGRKARAGPGKAEGKQDSPGGASEMPEGERGKEKAPGGPGLSEGGACAPRKSIFAKRGCLSFRIYVNI